METTTTNTDYSKLLGLAYPGQGWSLWDNHNFESLHWDSTNNIGKPSLDDLLQKLESVKPVEALRLLREKRNVLLADSDKYVLPDFPHASNEQKEAWLAYRQALRDLTISQTPLLTGTLELDDSSVIWPLKPSQY